jgi:ketose-bisphosphate aldolase
MTDMLAAAKAGRYAVGAFNILDYGSAAAVVAVAEGLGAPVIVQTSVKTVKYWGAEAMMSWLRQIAAVSPVPVAVHLDHCKEVALIAECIEAGWTSVMIDASALPFEENLSATREAAALAREAGVSIEAELGRVVGVEDEIFVSEQASHLADADEAVRFCEGLGLSAFAPAVGTAHGVYKGEPKIAFKLLEEVARRTGVPIALHGGTGLSDEVFRRCISLGAAKVNISTALKYAFIDGFVEYQAAHKDEKYDPLKVMAAQRERIERMVEEKITLFGSAGKA